MAVAAAKTRGRGRLLSGAWLGLAAALGGVLWLSLHEPRGITRVLPDGRGTELRGVTYGKHHEFRPGNWWQRTLPLQQLSAAAPDWPVVTDLRKHVLPVREHDTRADELVLWLVTHHATRNQDYLAAATIDDHGCIVNCSRNGWWGWLEDYFTTKGGQLPGPSPIELNVYPRSAKAFRFAVISPRDLHRVEFAVRNPAPSHARPWVGAACPVVAQVGDTQFVLRRLRHSQKATPFSKAIAEFEYLENGRAVHTWRPDMITVLDATGNMLETRLSAATQDRERTFDALCRFEPAWKLRVRFARTEKYAIASGDVWRLRDLPAPRPNQVTQLGLTRRFEDVTLRLARVTGGGDVSTPSNPGGFRLADVHLSADAPNSTVLLTLVECTDQSGRKLTCRLWWSHVVERPHTGCEFSFGPFSTVTRKLNPTFVVQRTQTVEFLVKP